MCTCESTRNLFPEGTDYEVVLERIKKDLAPFLHFQDQELLTSSNVTFNEVVVTTTLSADSVEANSFNLTGTNFRIAVVGQNHEIRFDGGDTFSYDTVNDCWDFNVAGSPIPDLRIKQGQILINDSLDNISPGDLNIGPNSVADIVLHRPTVLNPQGDNKYTLQTNGSALDIHWEYTGAGPSSNGTLLKVSSNDTECFTEFRLPNISQNDTTTEVLTRGALDRVYWNPTVVPTKATHPTTWTFPGQVGAVVGDIDYQILGNLVSIRLPAGLTYAANGFNVQVYNDTPLPVAARPSTEQQFPVKVENGGIVVLGLAYVRVDGEIRVYTDLNLQLFSGAVGNHTVFPITLTYHK